MRSPGSRNDVLRQARAPNQTKFIQITCSLHPHARNRSSVPKTPAPTHQCAGSMLGGSGARSTGDGPPIACPPSAPRCKSCSVSLSGVATLRTHVRCRRAPRNTAGGTCASRGSARARAHRLRRTGAPKFSQSSRAASMGSGSSRTGGLHEHTHPRGLTLPTITTRTAPRVTCMALMMQKSFQNVRPQRTGAPAATSRVSANHNAKRHRPAPLGPRTRVASHRAPRPAAPAALA